MSLCTVNPKKVRKTIYKWDVGKFYRLKKAAKERKKPSSKHRRRSNPMDQESWKMSAGDRESLCTGPEFIRNQSKLLVDIHRIVAECLRETCASRSPEIRGVTQSALDCLISGGHLYATFILTDIGEQRVGAKEARGSTN